MKFFCIALTILLVSDQIKNSYSAPHEEAVKKEESSKAEPKPAGKPGSPNLVKVNAVSMYCRKKSEVSQETIEKARKGHIEVNDEKMQKHLECFLMKLGYLKQGELDKKKLKKQAKKAGVSEEEANKAVEKCAVKKENGGKTATEAIVCLQKETNNKFTFHA